MGTLHIRKSRRGQHDAGNITLFLGCVILKQNYCVSYKCSKFKPTKTVVSKNIELLKILRFSSQTMNNVLIRILAKLISQLIS